MPDGAPARSVRLIFEFGPDGVRLLEQHSVNVPKSVPKNVTAGASRDPQTGDYVEVRNRDGQTVSRVPVWTGVGSTVETFPQDPYISADTPRVLTVVVPATPDADHVAVVRDSRDGGRTGLEVLGTFRLQP
ncbi:hypothetical protein [Lentzea kentuckyensis]|uniref:hypothetical protein n=1 Tax=Lentzea kentuckyensis TaxID=360086 RepID=UPI000A38C3BD|nr:hypothetical protein [Lentzea kentuckyensis]